MTLSAYWPAYLGELVEFQQIAEGEQAEFSEIRQEIQRIADEFFLVSLSEAGCARWERILGMSAASGATLESRREKIQIRYTNRLPYTYRTLEQYLSTYSDAVTLNIDSYTVNIRLLLQGLSQRGALLSTLSKMLPANMELHLQIYLKQSAVASPLIIGGKVGSLHKHTHSGTSFPTV